MRHDGIAFAEIEGFRPLLLDLHVPDEVKNPPVVVWVHGGGFRTGDRRYLPWTYPEESVWDTLLAAGVACASVDYRFTREATWPAQAEDVTAAIRFLRENAEQLGIDATRIGTWGESAGGHLALIAAYTDPDVRATVGFYPLTDILSSGRDEHDAAEAQLIGGVPSTLPYLARSASPTNYVGPKTPPTMLVHGDDDKVLPATQSAMLHERLLGAGAQSVLRPVPGADHCFEGHTDVQGLIDEAVAFLRANLGLHVERHQGDHGRPDAGRGEGQPSVGADGVELAEEDAVAAVDEVDEVEAVEDVEATEATETEAAEVAEVAEVAETTEVVEAVAPDDRTARTPSDVRTPQDVRTPNDVRTPSDIRTPQDVRAAHDARGGEQHGRPGEQHGEGSRRERHDPRQ
jgi:acetyl esterase/lipase